MQFGDKKRPSHRKNTAVWCDLAGRSTFYPYEQFCTLADPDSVEYESMMETGVICSPTQYHMVNNDASKIAALIKKYPLIPRDNFHLGDWCLVMTSMNPCPQGGIVYIDTMDEPDGIRPLASSMLISSMRTCGPGTLLCLNLCHSRPYTGKLVSLKRFYQNLEPHMDKNWLHVEGSDGTTGFYPPKTNRTQMLTIYFWRRP